jgi:hypothetical protein
VRARLTAWLSALLLIFNAALTVPGARITPNGFSSRIVYSWQKKQKRQLRNQAERLSISQRPALFAATPPTAAPPAIRAAVPLLDFSLFQRPPPALS